MNKIEIQLSKTKLLLGIGGSILFVVLGFYLFTTIADKPTRFNPLLVQCVGIAGILFFTATGIYGIMKVFDKKVGLTIDGDGIVDNTNASSLGLIKWSDIKEIKTEQVMSTKFLLVYVTDPMEILQRVKGIKRKLMEGNMKMYGTPLSITSNTLNCNFSYLEKILKDELEKHQGKVPNR